MLTHLLTGKQFAGFWVTHRCNCVSQPCSPRGVSHTLGTRSLVVFQSLPGDTIHKLPRAAFSVTVDNEQDPAYKVRLQSVKRDHCEPHIDTEPMTRAFVFSGPHAWRGSSAHLHKGSVKWTHTFSGYWSLRDTDCTKQSHKYGTTSGCVSL